jgi:peptide/nickel transport system substrate-binding protein
MHGKKTPAVWAAFAATLPLAGVAALFVFARGGSEAPVQESTPALGHTPPGPVAPDRFHPDGPAAGEPQRGGRVTLHIESLPTSLNALIESSNVTLRMVHELHEPLFRPDWETWEPRGVLVERWTSDEREDGGSVLTLHLRQDVRWHDGHPFDAGDVMFTWRCTKNPHVRCDAYRFLFDKLVHAEREGDYTVRFYLDAPYFNVLNGILYQFTVLPAHLYDLGDPDHPEHDPGASDEAQGRHVNEHPLNQDWIGLGPYRLAQRDDQTIEARRFDDYFDPERAGYLDTIRWRLVRGDEGALQAMLEGEIDFTARVPAEDFFGERTRSALFTERYYKGHFYTPSMTYTVWNTTRPQFADARVRRALGMSFDWDEFISSFFKGLGTRVTSEWYEGSPNYDQGIEPLPFDLSAARSLLTEAGWYDRDGDGLIDRDGQAFTFALSTINGSQSSAVYAQRLQENLEELGIAMEIVGRDYPTFAEAVGGRDFDAAHWAWYMPVVSDPEQMWHSRWIGPHTSNHGSLADPVVDGLIEALQVEQDEDERRRLFHELHARLYEHQVYMYGMAFPQKFAVSKRVRNLQNFAIEPGYSIRRWYLAE